MSLAQYAENLIYNGIDNVTFSIAKVVREPPNERETTEQTASKLSPKQSLPVEGEISDVLRQYRDRARDWLCQCLDEHESCHKTPRFSRIYGGGSAHYVFNLDNESAMPARLLKLEGTTFKLILTRSIGFVAYLCFSHRWGPDETFRTTKETLEDMMRSAPISGLPTSYREAAEFVIGLGYEYLWIDSLCIVQDDEEDWKIEAPRMSCTFGNAVCTISAVDSRSSDESILIEKHAENEGLRSRGWVLQEDMISSRTISFSQKTISWDCRCADANFTDSRLQMRSQQRSEPAAEDDSTALQLRIPQHRKDVFVFFRDFRFPGVEVTYPDGPCMVFLHLIEEVLEPKEQRPFLEVWWSLLPRYTELTLTRPSDKFIAISGITNIVRRNTHIRNFQGLWSTDDILFEICWYVDPDGPVGSDAMSLGMSAPLMAPSWSWAYLNTGRIRNDFLFKQPTHLACKPQIGTPTETSFEQPLPYQPWRWLTSRSIELKAALREVTFTRRKGEDPGKPAFEIDLEYPFQLDPKEVECNFRPDILDEFPLDYAFETTCAHIYYYAEQRNGVRYHVDNCEVIEDEQGNVKQDGSEVGFTRLSASLQWTMRFPVAPSSDPQVADDEA